jgi:hypothetical protein
MSAQTCPAQHDEHEQHALCQTAPSQSPGSMLLATTHGTQDMTYHPDLIRTIEKMRQETMRNHLEAELNRARLDSIELKLRLDSRILSSERESRMVNGPGGIDVHDATVDSYLGNSRWMTQNMDQLREVIPLSLLTNVTHSPIT